MEEKEKQALVALTAAIDKAYNHPRQLMWRSFLMGLLSGLGATVGVAIVIALLGFLIRELGGLPVIGDWLNDVGRFLPKSRS